MPAAALARTYVAEAAHWLLEPVNATGRLSADTEEARRVETRQVAVSRDSILVVDDSAAGCAYLVRLLHDEYDVRTAANGAEALRMARDRVPNLVLADVMMPGLNGVRLLRALRDDVHTCMVPVILISALVDEESRAEGFENGADDSSICSVRASRAFRAGWGSASLSPRSSSGSTEVPSRRTATAPAAAASSWCGCRRQRSKRPRYETRWRQGGFAFS